MHIGGRDFTIGADPELWLTKGGVPVSAHGVIQGTKANPFQVKRGAVQVDGMALEFNINPASDFRNFDRNITTVLDELQALIPEGHEINLSPSVMFDNDTMDSQPFEALALGCDPDYNAYTREKNATPHTQEGLRTAAGHIHVGWCKDMDPMDPTHFEACAQLTQQLDVYLGLPSLLWDNDQTRRSLYGEAGAFRPKSYGMEYRTLSNVWVGDKNTRAIVWRLVKTAITRLLKAEGRVDTFNLPIQRIINEGRMGDAHSVARYLLTSSQYESLGGTV